MYLGSYLLWCRSRRVALGLGSLHASDAQVVVPNRSGNKLLGSRPRVQLKGDILAGAVVVWDFECESMSCQVGLDPFIVVLTPMGDVVPAQVTDHFSPRWLTRSDLYFPI